MTDVDVALALKRSDSSLHVQDTGAAGKTETVVLLHGLAGSGRFWGRVIAHLPTTTRVIAPDLLGFGRSPWPSIDYTVDAHLAALQRDVFSRIEGPVHLVGHSAGAMLALEHAARRPEQAKSVSLLALPYFDDDEQARRLVALKGGWPWLMIHMPRFSAFMCSCICERRRFWQHILPRLLPRFPREVVVDGMLHSYQSVSSTMNKLVLGHRLDAAAQQVKDAGIAVAQIFDERDSQVPPERARAFHERYPWSSIHAVDGGGHGFPLDAAEETARLIKANIAARP